MRRGKCLFLFSWLALIQLWGSTSTPQVTRIFHMVFFYLMGYNINIINIIALL